MKRGGRKWRYAFRSTRAAAGWYANWSPKAWRWPWGGGLLGLAAARLLDSSLVRLIVPFDRSFHMDFTPDPLMVSFTVAVTLAAGLLFGLPPAWQATRSDAASRLKTPGRGGSGRMRWGRPLVSLQPALLLPLLAGPGCSRDGL